MPEVLNPAGKDYDPFPDLALLLGAALRAGRDGSVYAERITERLKLDPDGSADATEKALRDALGRPVRCESRSPDHAEEAAAALSASVWQRQQWGEHGSKDDLRSAAWELERAKVHALLGIEAAVSRLAAAPGPHPPAEDGGLRVLVHQYLKAIPGSTAPEIAAVLKVSAWQVLGLLTVMENDGEASRDETDRLAAGWRAT